MKIAIASDHRGFKMKGQVQAILTGLGYEPVDYGCFDERQVDYPDLAYAAASAVVEKAVFRAILICSAGMGMCIAANKVKGIRAVMCYDEFNAQVSRTHNDANVLCLAGDMIGSAGLHKIIKTWLETKFTGGRHQIRINKIKAIEEGRDPREKP